MTKFSLPIVLPAATKVTVSQPFGVTSNTLEPVGPDGQPHFHYGVDLVWGSPGFIFGTPLVLPADAVSQSGYELPPGAPNTTPFTEYVMVGASGTKYNMILAHVSQIFMLPQLKAGEVVALAGNYGIVAPQPTIAAPFGGSHLHLGLQANGVWVDPLEYFDITKFTIGPVRDPANCVPRINWACQQVEAELQQLVTNAKA